nr:MAG TPA: hypothetical protein [Caudoviricetes sp.]
MSSCKIESIQYKSWVQYGDKVFGYYVISVGSIPAISNVY